MARLLRRVSRRGARDGRHCVARSSALEGLLDFDSLVELQKERLIASRVRTLGLAEVIFAQRTSGREAFGIRLILAGAALAQRRMRLGGGALGGGKRNLAIGVLFWGAGGGMWESATRHKRMWVSLGAAAKKQNAPPRMIGRGVLFIAE